MIVDFIGSGSETLDSVFPKEGEHVETKRPSRVESAKSDNIDSSDSEGSSHEPPKNKSQPKRQVVKEKNSTMSKALRPIQPKKRKKKSWKKKGMTFTSHVHHYLCDLARVYTPVDYSLTSFTGFSLDFDHNLVRVPVPSV